MADAHASDQGWIHRIQANPLDLPAYRGLADFYRSRGALRQAALTLCRAIEIDPLDASLRRTLGAVRAQSGDWRGALDAFEQATELAPLEFGAWYEYAATLLALQEARGARSACARLLRCFPEYAGAHLLAGHAHKASGAFTKASASYRRALQRDPRSTEALFNLVDIQEPNPQEDVVAQINALSREPVLGVRERANVCAALARIRESAGEIDAAFALYTEANESLRRMSHGTADEYRQKSAEQEINNIVQLFPASLNETLEPIDLPLRLIFIVGMPRSGTTLVERILAEHPDVRAGGELPHMAQCLARAGAEKTGVAFDLRNPGDRRLLTQLRRSYLDGLVDRDLDGNFVTDKLPANFRALGLIRLLFPDAVLLHVRRNPVANAWSLYRAHLDQHLSYHTRLADLVHYFRNVYARVMTHWEHSAAAPITVTYESLICDTASERERLFSACGLEPPRQLASGCDSGVRGSSDALYTASAVTARLPIFSSSLERWRPFERHLGELIQGLAPAGAC